MMNPFLPIIDLVIMSKNDITIIAVIDNNELVIKVIKGNKG